MPGHLPLITTIRPGVLTVSTGGGRRHFAVASGYAEIDDDRVSVLTEACLTAKQVDAAQARSDLESAEQAMASTGPVDPSFDENARAAAWARARIDVSERR